MNKEIQALLEQSGLQPYYVAQEEHIKKFAKLLIEQSIRVVAEVPPGYKDYRSQIEETMRNDCVDYLKRYWGVE